MPIVRKWQNIRCGGPHRNFRLELRALDERPLSGGPTAERRLDHYARPFQTVELNASYYRWPSDASFAGWQRRLPDGFVVTVKAPGALTHAKRLYGPEAWLARIV